LVVGAHPDDEDTSVLALVARAQGGEAAYLSLSRGEGGQNLIGTELGVGLGLIRSRELLAAREIDGARQFFTRAYDFGYTRSLDETFERWPREALLEDALRIVRRFRPQVIISVFPPNARAGHGQHQAAGVIAGDVFRHAGDPDVVAGLKGEGLGPWSPEALYRAGFFDRDAEALETPLGVVDPLDGRSVIQLARASRSQHRSQDMGSLQRLGGTDNRLIPVAGSAKTEGNDPFAGIDTSLAALASPLPVGERKAAVVAHLQRVEELALKTRGRLSPMTLGATTGPIVEILQELSAAREALGESIEPASATGSVAAFLEEKRRIAEQALAAAGGVALDAYADRGALVAGSEAEVTLEIWNSSKAPVEVHAAQLQPPEGWQAQADEASARALAPGELGSWRWTVRLPPKAESSQPYFLERPRVGDLYDWSAVAPEIRGAPFGPAPLRAQFSLTVGGQRIEVEREVVYRYPDQAIGEIRRPLRVAPKVEVKVGDQLLVWPVFDGQAKIVEVEVFNPGSQPVEGVLRVVPPRGWPSPEPVSFALAAKGDRQTFELALNPPTILDPGDHSFRFEAAVDGQTYDRALPLLEYSHIRPTPLPRAAELLVRAVELHLPSVSRVGYVRGASDRVPEALRQIGVAVEELSAASLTREVLAGLDVVVIGSRAYETRPELAQGNERLLEFVRGGGRLIVQYQQYQFVRGEFAPFPLSIERPHARVTDETASVKLLDSDHPLFHEPNGIGPEDWKGWVQERGLYFPSTWDAAYKPLLAMSDPDGPRQEGGLLVARLGQGTYIYTGLAFFRQLPAGVIGGYRLFLNLLQPE